MIALIAPASVSYKKPLLLLPEQHKVTSCLLLIIQAISCQGRMLKVPMTLCQYLLHVLLFNCMLDSIL